MASNSISRPQVGGHPLMANILKLAEHRSKQQQNKQKMEHELLKAQVHTKKTHADIKRMHAQVETNKASADTQLKLMSAKAKALKQSQDLKKQEREAAWADKKENLAFQKQAKQQDLTFNRQSKKQDLDYQRKTFSLEKQRSKLKQSSASALNKRDSKDRIGKQPTTRRSPSQQKSRSNTHHPKA